METERENKFFFVYVEFICEQGKIYTIEKKGKVRTTVYRKPSFSGVYSNFQSYLSSVYKSGMVNTLTYKCIHSYWR